MKYYYPEHIAVYEKIKREGQKVAWRGADFERFPSRAFLEKALPQLCFSVDGPEVLEYGCGTGASACFLAKRGFKVDGMDLIPTAIELAKRFAQEQNLNVYFQVQDICELPHKGKTYDMIVDSFCLQSIVTDADRNKVFAVVRARLKAEGYYLISTALLDEDAYYPEQTVIDVETGIAYNRYGDGDLRTETGIVYIPVEDSDDYPDTIKIDNQWYLPHRRHLTLADLKSELGAAGFKVLYWDEDRARGGHMICALDTVERGRGWRS